MEKHLHSPEIQDRFWAKVERRSDHHCWPWKAGRSKNGYGAFKDASNLCRGAHQVAWEIENGEALAGRLACHICDNKLCCNPAHIYAGNRRENMLDMLDRGKHKTPDQSGENNGNAKLTALEVLTIRERIAAGETNVSIAKDFPVTHQMISKIRRGGFWESGRFRGHIGGQEG